MKVEERWSNTVSRRSGPTSWRKPSSRQSLDRLRRRDRRESRSGRPIPTRRASEGSVHTNPTRQRGERADSAIGSRQPSLARRVSVISGLNDVACWGELSPAACHRHCSAADHLANETCLEIPGECGGPHAAARRSAPTYTPAETTDPAMALAEGGREANRRRNWR
jgi:hypothetical protein